MFELHLKNSKLSEKEKDSIKEKSPNFVIGAFFQIENLWL